MIPTPQYPYISSIVWVFFPLMLRAKWRPVLHHQLWEQTFKPSLSTQIVVHDYERWYKHPMTHFFFLWKSHKTLHFCFKVVSRTCNGSQVHHRDILKKDGYSGSGDQPTDQVILRFRHMPDLSRHRRVYWWL